MNKTVWSKLAAAADSDPGFARRLLDVPELAAAEVGELLSADDVRVLRAFAGELPSLAEIARVSPGEVELVMMPNH